MAERKAQPYNCKNSAYSRKPAAEKRPHTPPPVRSYADLTPTVRRGDIFFFTAESLSVPGKVNTVAYCPTDDTSHCDCFAAEYGRACWHTRLVRFPGPDAEPDPTPPPAAPALAALPPVVQLHELAPTGTEGYRPAPPPARSWPGGANTDAEVCHEARCGRCGRRGLDYHPYTRDKPCGYRAFAVCPACGHATEF